MTATATSKSRFLNSLNARILSLIVAVAIALGGFLIYNKDVGKPLMKADVPGGAEAILRPYAERSAVNDCKSQRLAEISKLTEQGLLSEADAATARERAITMCSERN
jgi:hypothetical protein